ncbi:MAG: GNAT family N-acetyltransferase [Clostridia bacterium]
MELKELHASHLEEAATLLSARHARERLTYPVLPDSFEDPQQALTVLQALQQKENAIGVGAFRGNKLVGYMLGAIDTDKNRERHVWIDYAGSAISGEESPERYRDLYAWLGEKWVNHGAFDHYVVVPGGDSMALDAWFRLGFGHQQVHAIQHIPEPLATTPNVTDFHIRRATKEDEAVVRSFATLIMEHQAKAPVWAPGFPEERRKLQDGYAGLLEDEEVWVWLASSKEGAPLGFQAYWPTSENMMTPGMSISLGVGATLPEARGKGVASALTRHGLSSALQSGYTRCVTDWRMTNLQSSRFWPDHGFIPIAYRLARNIDRRMAWATGRRHPHE